MSLPWACTDEGFSEVRLSRNIIGHSGKGVQRRIKRRAAATERHPLRAPSAEHVRATWTLLRHAGKCGD